MSKVLIAVPVWNRKKVTELVLTQLYKHKGDNAEVWVYNDWSTEYDNDWLSTMSDKVIKLPASKKVVIKNERNSKGMGVQHLRWYQFREFLKQDEFDFIYMTDSDAFHDPNYMETLLKLHGKYKTKNGTKLPVCLYNTIHHSQPQNTKFQNDEVMLRITAPGISMLYSREMVEKIVESLEIYKKQTGEDPIYAWDYRAQEWLRRPWITSKTSYIEHYGADENSMHTPKGMWDRDRAVNPTEYLQSNRNDLISYLEGKADKPEI
jgi:glycosyltransferase involved in cell wall biosynthesis